MLNIQHPMNGQVVVQFEIIGGGLLSFLISVLKQIVRCLFLPFLFSTSNHKSGPEKANNRPENLTP
jgi:hypothetical protein